MRAIRLDLTGPEKPYGPTRKGYGPATAARRNFGLRFDNFEFKNNE